MGGLSLAWCDSRLVYASDRQIMRARTPNKIVLIAVDIVEDATLLDISLYALLVILEGLLTMERYLKEYVVVGTTLAISIDACLWLSQRSACPSHQRRSAHACDNFSD